MNRRSMMLLLAIALMLAGCSAADRSTIDQSEQASADESSQGSRWFDEVEAADVTDAAAALAAMTDTVKTLKQSIEQADEPAQSAEAAAQSAEELASVWKALEAEAHSADDKLAGELTAGIIELADAAQAKAPDRDRLIEADYRIYQAIRDVTQLFE